MSETPTELLEAEFKGAGAEFTGAGAVGGILEDTLELANLRLRSSRVKSGRK